MWAILYSEEASDYLFDNFPYTENVDLGIIALSMTEQGIPAEGAHEVESGMLMCTIERHTVVYERKETEKILIVHVIKPRTELL